MCESGCCEGVRVGAQAWKLFVSMVVESAHVRKNMRGEIITLKESVLDSKTENH
jgi:hypothetical protein